MPTGPSSTTFRTYCVHDRINVAIEELATCESTHTLLAPFAASTPVDAAHLIVMGTTTSASTLHGSERRSASPSQSPRVRGALSYGDSWVHDHRMGVYAARTEAGWLLAADRDVEAYVLPFLDELLTRAGLASIHAAALSTSQGGIVIGGWGGAGKTSSLAHLLRHEDTAFLSDDIAFLSTDGKIFPYPKSMYIYPYHRSLYPHLFASRHKPMVPAVASAPVAKLREMVRPVFQHHPRLESWARKWTPEHMKVAPADAFPSTAISGPVSLRRIVYLERNAGSSTESYARDKEWAANRLTSTLAAEYAQRARDFLTLCSAAGVFPFDDWIASRRRIIQRALSGPVEITNLAVSPAVKASDVGAQLSNHVFR